MRDVDSQITRMRGERTKGDLIYAWTREISHARCLTFANCASNDTIVGEYFIVSSYFWTFNIALSSIPSWTVNVYDVCGSNQITKRDDHNETDSNLYFMYLWGREIYIHRIHICIYFTNFMSLYFRLRLLVYLISKPYNWLWTLPFEIK